MIGRLIANPWVILGLVAAIGAGGIWIAVAAYQRGVADTKSDAREAIFNQLKERNVTDAEIKDMPDAALCRAIGGELRDDRCE